jgi:hypothetical protein
MHIRLLLGLLDMALAGAMPAAAQNRFNLVNSTGQTMQRIAVSPSWVSSRGRRDPHGRYPGGLCRWPGAGAAPRRDPLGARSEFQVSRP